MSDLAQGMGSGSARPSGTRVGAAVEFFFLAFLAAACLMLTDFMDVNEPKWFLIRVAAPMLLAVDLFAARRTEGLRPGLVGGLAIAFLALHAVSTIVAVNVGRAWTEVSESAGLVCAFLLAMRLSAQEMRRNRLLWTLVLIGAAVAVYGIAQHFGHDFMSWEDNNEVLVARGVSFFGHATFTASVLIQIIPIAVGLFMTRGAWPARLASGAAAGLMLYHLSFTGARMATLSLVLTAAASATWIGWRGWRAGRARGLRLRVVAAGLALVLVAGAGAGWFVVRAWQAKQSDLFAIRQASLALRLIHWETAGRVVFSHPVMGVGAGNYEVVSPRYWNAVEEMRTARHGRWMQQAHNEYLQTAAELGLPGVALLLTLMAYGVVMALDVGARAPARGERGIGVAMAASIAAIALDANITFSLQAPGSALVFWTMLGLIAGSHARLGGGSGLSSRREQVGDGTEHVLHGEGFRQREVRPVDDGAFEILAGQIAVPAGHGDDFHAGRALA